MPTRYFEALAPAVLAAAFAALPAGSLRAAEADCSRQLPCSEQQFLASLKRVADERDLSRLQATFYEAFSIELARYTSVLVSTLLDTPNYNQVRRFVRLGDSWYPLSFGAPGACLGFEPLESALQADGWSGGRTAAVTAPPQAAAAGADALPAGGSEVWAYRKGRTQLWVEPIATRDAAGVQRSCAGSILLTYR